MMSKNFFSQAFFFACVQSEGIYSGNLKQKNTIFFSQKIKLMSKHLKNSYRDNFLIFGVIWHVIAFYLVSFEKIEKCVFCVLYLSLEFSISFPYLARD